MVHKRITLGKNDDVTIIEFGQGDILVSSGQFKSEKIHAVLFTNDKVKKVGKKNKLKETPPIDAMITFSSIESLEVLQKTLKEIKKRMKS